jgi:type I restriction enzyme M protein
MPLRAELLSTFQGAVRVVGLLDRFQVAGVIASWWGDSQNDLKTVVARGFLGLVESWEVSILNAMDDKRSKNLAVDHKLVKRLLPQYLSDIEDIQARKIELDTLVKAASDSQEETNVAEDAIEGLSEDELKATKKQLTAVKKELKGLQGEFVEQLQKARLRLDEESARELVMDILSSELRTVLSRYVATQRRLAIAAFEMWWDKYRTTLKAIDDYRDETSHTLQEVLFELGYGA